MSNYKYKYLVLSATCKCNKVELKVVLHVCGEHVCVPLSKNLSACRG